MSDVRAAWEAAVLTSDLPDSLKITCWAIRTFANKFGECFPSQQTLATTRNCSDRTVRRHLVALEKRGLIRRDKGEGQTGIGGATDLMTLTVSERPDTHDVRTSECDDSEKDRTNLNKDRTDSDKDRTNSTQRPDTSVSTEPLTIEPKNQASRCDARVGNDMTNEQHEETPRKTDNPRVRQEVIKAVEDYGSRDARAALLFIRASFPNLEFQEAEAAIHELLQAGRL